MPRELTILPKIKGSHDQLTGRKDREYYIKTKKAIEMMTKVATYQTTDY